MVTDRDVLKGFMAGRGVDRTRVDGLMRTLEPLYRVAEAGAYPLADASQLNLANAARALAPAVGLAVPAVDVVRAGDPLRADLRRTREYATHLPDALRRCRRASLVAALAPREIDALVAAFWSGLGGPLVAAFQRDPDGFLGQLDQPFAADVAFGPAIAAFYCAAYVLLGSASESRAMLGLVRLLPWAVPLGAPAGGRGRWIFVTA